MQQTTQNIFMVRPAHFGYNEQTALSNTFQNKPAQEPGIRELALQEFDHAVDTLKEKGINVWVIEDVKDKINPDAVFPNNWISTHEDGTLVLYPMLTPNRRTERREDVVQALKEQFEVKNVIDLSPYEADQKFLEGTGSIVFDHTARVAYACLSPRTDKGLLETLCDAIGYTPLSFHAENEQGIEIYHTNVVMGIGAQYAVICLESITDKQEKERVVRQLEEDGKEIIDISFGQMNHFGGNVLALESRSGQPYLALSALAYHAFTPEQLHALEKHTSLLPLEIPTIERIGGGSVRCMIAQNFLHPRLKS